MRASPGWLWKIVLHCILHTKAWPFSMCLLQPCKYNCAQMYNLFSNSFTLLVTQPPAPVATSLSMKQLATLHLLQAGRSSPRTFHYKSSQWRPLMQIFLREKPSLKDVHFLKMNLSYPTALTNVCVFYSPVYTSSSKWFQNRVSNQLRAPVSAPNVLWKPLYVTT